MIFSRLLNEFAVYSGTEDFARGVLVEITGIAIEVILLSITIPLILSIVRRIHSRPIRTMVDFYLFQIFHKIIQIFLDMASVKVTMTTLMEEKERNPEIEIFWHRFYGNLENLLFVLKKALKSVVAVRKRIASKSLEDFLRYQSVCERCLEEIDRLTAMLVGVPKVQEELFKMRILVYSLRDMIEKVTQDIQAAENEPIRRSSHMGDVLLLAQQLTDIIDAVFRKRRKLIDSVLTHQEWASNVSLVLSLFYIMPRRWLSYRMCRLRNKPYRDFLFPSDTPDVLRNWRNERGFSVADAATALEITADDYHDFEFGYRKPGIEVWEIIRQSQIEKPSETDAQSVTDQT